MPCCNMQHARQQAPRAFRTHRTISKYTKLPKRCAGGHEVEGEVSFRSRDKQFGGKAARQNDEELGGRLALFAHLNILPKQLVAYGLPNQGERGYQSVVVPKVNSDNHASRKHDDTRHVGARYREIPTLHTAL